MGLRGLRGNRENLTDFAVGYTDRRSADGRDEKVAEAFHRRQLTYHTLLSLGVQGIFNPGNSAVAVFTARFRVAF